MAEKHYMIKLRRKNKDYYTEERVLFPAYMEHNYDKCLGRFHQYARQIGFTTKVEKEVYNGGCIYQNPKDETEILRFR